MSLLKGVLALALTVLAVNAGEVMVQLNVNRPFNDVNEKFVSFAMKPEDLYKALDGPNRKTVTRIATMLGDSYVKFTGDYYFASGADEKLRNPTRIIWKGFNRWTRAVNWTMIIPVPYTPNSWDAMQTLKILNNSYFVGITDCIWQLGTDFGSSRAQDYVGELQTLNLMVDTFKPYVTDWQIMGADISVGSSAGETVRYVDMTKDLNAAYGWLQSSEPITQAGSYIHETDPALKSLLNKKVPVWLTLSFKPKGKRSKHASNRLDDDAVNEALRWALTLGEAASTGFDAVFRRVDLVDLEKPSLSFYVTALFKKVMGSRVFPARPLNVFTRSNKLYTHCANAVSGGIAFMIVNPDVEPIQIAIRSWTKFTGTEYWQYILTFKKGTALLNNERLTLNSTLMPQKKTKSPNKLMQLTTPGKSVGFWVLPTADLEHCQYTEIEANELEPASQEKVVHKRYSSSDLLLRKLIQETALSHSALSRAVNRGRRYATFADRHKRFVLEDKSEKPQGLGKLFEPLKLEEKAPKHREHEVHEKRAVALQWITDLLDRALMERDNESPLKRNARSTDDYFAPLFGGVSKSVKKPTFVKKITEIRKPEQKDAKPIFSLENFDEEEFFKKMGAQSEPEVPRVPDGDVHLRHITNADGDEEEDYREVGDKHSALKKSQKMVETETVNEMKPLRLLPTEFYEALPLSALGQHKSKLANTWNKLFPEPFSKKSLKRSKKSKKSKEEKEEKEKKEEEGKEDEEEDEEEQHADAVSDVEAIGGGRYHSSGHLAADFLRTQEELARAFLRENESSEKEEEKPTAKEEKTSDNSKAAALPEEINDKIKTLRSKYIDYIAENLENYFTEHEPNDESDKVKDAEQTKESNEKDVSWWDLGIMRRRRSPRALHYQLPDEAWLSNMITKEEDLTPLGSAFPEELVAYDQQFISENRRDKETNTIPDVAPATGTGGKKPKQFVTTVKERLNKFVDILARHVSEWYNTLTKPIEHIATVETTTTGNQLN